MKTQIPFLSLLTALSLALVACEPGTRPTPATPGSPETAPQKAAFMKDVDTAEAEKLVTGENPPIVIDVRTPEEFAEGHIEGAINVDVKGENFEAELAKLDPEKEYLLHCRSGARSTSAKPTFEKLGFKSVYHMSGGFDAWTDAGLPGTTK